MIRFLEYNDLHNGFLVCLGELYEVDWLACGKVFAEKSMTKNTYILVYVENFKILGTASLILDRKFGHNGRYSAIIEDVAVRKESQGKGVGEALVRVLIKSAQDLGAYKVILNSSDHNLHFYEKLGFKKHENAMRLDL